MIFVDNRSGSSELIPQLLSKGFPVEGTRLSFGDLCFESKDGLDIGIEFKKLPDLVQSLRSGRLSGHQAPGMLGPNGAYDYAIILYEGEWMTGKTGLVVVPKWRGRRKTWAPVKGSMPASELRKRLFTLAFKGGFYVEHTDDRSATLDFIGNCYRWWTDKSLDDHTTLDQPHVQGGFLPLSDFRATIIQRFPGVGLKASAAIEAHFHGRLRDAVNADVMEWAAIDISNNKGGSKRLGIKVAEKIIDFVRGQS